MGLVFSVTVVIPEGGESGVFGRNFLGRVGGGGGGTNQNLT